MEERTSYIQVAVDSPLTQALTYKLNVPYENLNGSLVTVPLGKRQVKGVILSTTTKQPCGNFEVKKILQVEKEFPALDEASLTWARWLSEYYKHPLGQTLRLFFPPLKKSSRSSPRKRSPIPFVKAENFLVLNSHQKKVVDSIQNFSKFQTHLIHGVTGSGKTEVYMRLIRKALVDKSKQVLFLVPEITLTPQMLESFSKRFGDKLAIINSGLTPREKTNQWWRAYLGEAQILIGARSALFCPLKSLSLIIIDEEHESSFKQDSSLCYNARDAAIKKAQLLNIPIILGSATPSAETWFNCQKNISQKHELPQKVFAQDPPTVSLVDLREVQRNKKLPFWLTPTLHEKITKHLEQNNQVCLFLNQRGKGKVALCTECGFSHTCPNCDVKLTLHGTRYLSCHYCDYQADLKSDCPNCQKSELKIIGLGTEKVQEDLETLFPKARVGRMDRDEIQNRIDLEDRLSKMKNQEIDILIGTQMVAKGLDFANLTLVGFVLCDIGLSLPDFRGTEKNFSLIRQVMGRCGRSEKKSEVVIQTYNPHHPSIQAAIAPNIESFMSELLNVRKAFNYPPYCRLARVLVQGMQEKTTQDTALKLTDLIQQLQQKYPELKPLKVCGPTPAPLSKLAGKWRYHFLIKSPSAGLLSQLLKEVISQHKRTPKIKVIWDIDPVNML